MNLTDLLDGVQCPRCGRENTYVKRDIERVAQVDGNTVTVTITVGECTFCGEQLLDDAATRRLEDAVEKIRSGVIGGLTATGTAYHYP